MFLDGKLASGSVRFLFTITHLLRSHGWLFTVLVVFFNTKRTVTRASTYYSIVRCVNLQEPRPTSYGKTIKTTHIGWSHEMNDHHHHDDQWFNHDDDDDDWSLDWLNENWNEWYLWWLIMIHYISVNYSTVYTHSVTDSLSGLVIAVVDK